MGLREPCPIGGEGIESGSSYDGIAIATKGVGPMIIGDHENDIRRTGDDLLDQA
jgi:hypothetical protein